MAHSLWRTEIERVAFRVTFWDYAEAIYLVTINGGDGCSHSSPILLPDLDADTDADLNDFAVFQDCFNGPNRSVACEYARVARYSA